MSSELSVEHVGKMYRVMRTVGEMCIDRKYLVPEEWFPASIDDFKHKYMTPELNHHIERDRMTLVCANRDGEHIVAFFVAQDVNIALVQDFHRRAADQSIPRVLIIMGGKMNPIAKKGLLDIGRQDSGVRFQVFEEEEVVVNITRHELVPKHTPLEPQEAVAVLDAHKLQLQQLPRIMATDPIALYFGAERGRVIKITRRSETAGQYITFRQVV